MRRPKGGGGGGYRPAAFAHKMQLKSRVLLFVLFVGLFYSVDLQNKTTLTSTPDAARFPVLCPTDPRMPL
jgi:hypothetical protein